MLESESQIINQNYNQVTSFQLLETTKYKNKIV